MVYWIKYDYGYGDWGVCATDLNEKDAIEMFNERNCMDFTTIEECLFYEFDAIYTVHMGEPEENNDWLSS